VTCHSFVYQRVDLRTRVNARVSADGGHFEHIM